MKKTLDEIDRRILAALQRDASAPLAALAEEVGLSPSPCWRRIQRMKDMGVLSRNVWELDPHSVNLSLTVFVAIRAREHNAAWLEEFRTACRAIPEIVEIHRLAGDVDYLLKVMAPDISAFDAIYKRLTEKIALASVTSMISMEAMHVRHGLPLDYCVDLEA
ncbi:MAG: Lrp/AsnC family transcriptional regulator [Pseudomonadota bacterium]